MRTHICHIKCTCGHIERVECEYDLPEPPITHISPGSPLEVYIDDILLCGNCKKFIDAQSAQSQAEAEIQIYLNEVKAGV